jgi:signal transduction histidine kinase
LLRACSSAYGTLAAADAPGLRGAVDPALPGMVRGDPLRVRQIVSNYLSNALKFTAAARCGCWPARGRRPGALEVHDTGPASTPDPQARLFRTLHAGRRIHHPALRRHRPGPVDLPPAGHV